MTRTRLTTFLAGAAVIPLTGLAIAAVANGATASSATHVKPATGRVANSATVQVRGTKLGKILVNSQGRTLYLFKKDSGRRSACTGECAKFWPPLRASGKPTAGRGIAASKLGTIRRSDGKPQVTYGGHPLYTFQQDTKAGQTNGQGVRAFGASWFTLSPAGNQISGHAAGRVATRSAAPAGGGHHTGNVMFRSSIAPSEPTDPTLNGVVAGGAPWVIDRGEVTIKRHGRLRLDVTGLVIPELGNAGPVNSISASIACADEAPADKTQTVALSQSGDATIKDDLNLPSTCLGPRVFVNPNGIGTAYIALSGWRL
jgi:predicted lipoprotein with Yx(FWY)xxD motif